MILGQGDERSPISIPERDVCTKWQKIEKVWGYMKMGIIGDIL